MTNTAGTTSDPVARFSKVVREREAGVGRRTVLVGAGAAGAAGAAALVGGVGGPAGTGSVAQVDEDLAYHEAGHAVMHALNGGTVERVSIERGDPQRGVRVQPFAEAGMSEPEARRRIAVLVAGEVGLFLHGGERRQVPDSVDREHAMRTARAAGVGDAAANALIAEEWERVRERLRDATVWGKVEALAQALAQRRTLDGAEVHRLIDGAGR